MCFAIMTYRESIVSVQRIINYAQSFARVFRSPCQRFVFIVITSFVIACYIGNNCNHSFPTVHNNRIQPARVTNQVNENQIIVDIIILFCLWSPGKPWSHRAGNHKWNLQAEVATTSHGHHDLSNHQQLFYLHNSLFSLTTNKYQPFSFNVPLWGESLGDWCSPLVVSLPKEAINAESVLMPWYHHCFSGCAHSVATDCEQEI